MLRQIFYFFENLWNFFKPNLPTINRLNKNLDFLPLSWRFASQCRRVGRWWWWKQNNLFCFSFFLVFLLIKILTRPKIVPAATVHVLKQKNIKINYQKQAYPFLHTSIILLLYILYNTLLLYGANYFILSEVCTRLRLKSVALMLFLWIQNCTFYSRTCQNLMSNHQERR